MLSSAAPNIAFVEQDPLFAGFRLSRLLVAESLDHEPLVVRKSQTISDYISNTSRPHALKQTAAGDFYVLPQRADRKFLLDKFPDALCFTDALCRGFVDLDSGIYKREISDCLIPTEPGTFSSFWLDMTAHTPSSKEPADVSDSDGELLD